MKAIHYTAFGGPEVIELVDLPRPVITHPNEILVRVKATTVNPLDMKIREGWMQGVFPVQLPYVPGLEASGVVEAVGDGVQGLAPGTEVMASARSGTYAEFAVFDASNVSVKPEALSFNEAASLVVPLASAWSVLVSTAELKAGQRVLIQGAGGAVGSAMVQMAKAIGASVIGTASGDGVAHVRALGADEVIDYRMQDVSRTVDHIDLVVDLVGGETQARSFACLKKGGKLVSLTAPPSQELAQQHGVTATFISSDLSAKAMVFGLGLVAEGRLRPVVARTMRLLDAAQAQALVSAGSVNGKVVLEVG